MPVSNEVEQKIIDTWKNLPDDVKSLIPDEKSAKKNDYKAAYKKAHDLSQSKAVVQKYLLDNYGRRDLFPEFDKTLDSLTKIFDEAGLEETSNPFINYINLADNNNNKAILTNSNIVDINNWYADEILDYNDISGSSSEKRNHPIFQQNFFKSENPDFILKSYIFLSNIGKVKNLNFEALVNWALGNKNTPKLPNDDALLNLALDYNAGVKNIKNISAYDMNEIRSAIINNSTSDYTKFRNPEEIKKLLQILNREKGYKQNNNDALTNVSKILGQLKKEERIKVVQAIIDKYKDELV